MSLFTEFLATGVLLLNVAFVSLPVLYILKRQELLTEQIGKIDTFLSNYWKHLSFVLVFFATSGSLYLSNSWDVLGTTVGMGLSPCHLCWFQRIFMYPLVLMFGVSIYLKETVSEYAIPMTIIGGGIAGYHYLIQRVDQFSSAGCSVTSISCEATQIPFYYGYISIPIMAFTGFFAVLLLSWKYGDF